MSGYEILKALLKREVKELKHIEKTYKLCNFDITYMDLRLDGAMYFAKEVKLITQKEYEKFLLLKSKTVQKWYERVKKK